MSNIISFPVDDGPETEHSEQGAMTRIFTQKPTDEELIFTIAMDIRAALGMDKN